MHLLLLRCGPMDLGINSCSEKLFLASIGLPISANRDVEAMILTQHRRIAKSYERVVPLMLLVGDLKANILKPTQLSSSLFLNNYFHYFAKNEPFELIAVYKLQLSDEPRNQINLNFSCQLRNFVSVLVT